jgi:hypothetical protein
VVWCEYRGPLLAMSKKRVGKKRRGVVARCWGQRDDGVGVGVVAEAENGCEDVAAGLFCGQRPVAAKKIDQGQENAQAGMQVRSSKRRATHPQLCSLSAASQCTLLGALCYSCAVSASA